MATITIRVDDSVFKKIEMRRGDRNKSEYYREILEYFLSHEDNLNTKDEDLLAERQKVIEYLQEENRKLLELLNQAQILQLQAQKALLPDQNTNKAWWQFWKR